MDKEKQLPSGKLSPEALKRNVLSYTGMKKEEILIGPAVGEDASVIKWNANKYMVFSSDPIVGADKGAGKLLVRINSNDIASKGGEPLYLAVTLILPPVIGEAGASKIMREIHEECIDEGIAIVGGHTEFNDKYDKPVIMGALIGEADKILKATDIETDDYIIVTKHIGIEGMSILAADREDLLSQFMNKQEIEEILSWSDETSVLEESRVIRQYAKFMHDPTEGGFLGGMGEIIALSGLEAEIENEKIPLHPLTKKAAEKLSFDPLHLIASGSLIAIIAKEEIDKAEKALQKSKIKYAKIGQMGNKLKSKIEEPKEELWRLLKMDKKDEK
ncbi:MAG: AIR synthase-related protein [Synergistaceae bacterium]